MNSLASVEFKFTNTGNKPLVITSITSSCDCAEPIWQKKPVKSGKSGIITVKYDTSYPGIFMKTISVFANIENNPVQLTINGIIEP